MHSILLGVCRQMASLWLDSKNHQIAFYLRKKIEKVDSRLLLIKPPSYINRTPRSIQVRKFWKANEWHAWLLYFRITVLENNLPDLYLAHWMLLCDAIATLLKASISKAEIQHAGQLLIVYCAI